MKDVLFILMFALVGVIACSTAFMKPSKKEIILGTKKIVKITIDDLHIKAILFVQSYKGFNKLIVDSNNLLCKSRILKDDYKYFTCDTSSDRKFIFAELKIQYWKDNPEIIKEYL